MNNEVKGIAEVLEEQIALVALLVLFTGTALLMPIIRNLLSSSASWDSRTLM
jgi:hypothetical protein